MPAYQNASSLPAVLKTYNPSYEPSRKVEAPKAVKSSNEVTNPPAKKAEEKKPEANRKPEASRRRVESPFRRPFSREKTVDLTAQEREKRLKSYRYWELVKQELKEEDTERLKQRIYLQLNLIHAQEALFQAKVQEEEDERRERREEERAQKQAQVDSLLATCRKSLAQDRRKKRVGQRQSKSTTVHGGGVGDRASKVSGGGISPIKSSASKTPLPVESLPTRVLLNDSDDERDDMPPLPTGFVLGSKKEGTEISSGKSSLASTPQPPSGANTPLLREITTNITREVTRASTLQEEEEEGDGDEEEEEDEFVDFPHYQQHLYRLYGRTVADSFLYPKVEAEAKKKSKPLDPKFKNPDGRTGANELWTNLRHESRSKLLRVDRTIKDELKANIMEYRKRVAKKKHKDAFGCFARESLSLKRPKVKRNFCNKDDVPEIDQLMDQSIVQGAQDYRHRMELMYRSSHINEDRCKVLMFNNPIPNLNNRQGEDSVSRYMPSWADSQEEIVSERSYKKWLLTGDEAAETGSVSEVTGVTPKNQPSAAESKVRSDKSEHNRPEVSEKASVAEKSAGRKETGRTSVNEEEAEALMSLPGEWDFMMVPRQTGDDKPKPPRYHFLTEREARTPGQFRKRQEEARKARDLPQSYKPRDGSQSAAPHLSVSFDQAVESTGRSAFAMSTDFTLSSGRPHTLSTQQEVPSWEPLSLDALMEYKERRHGLGTGDYRRGKAATWHRQQAAIVEG